MNNITSITNRMSLRSSTNGASTTTATPTMSMSNQVVGGGNNNNVNGTNVQSVGSSGGSSIGSNNSGSNNLHSNNNNNNHNNNINNKNNNNSNNNNANLNNLNGNNNFKKKEYSKTKAFFIEERHKDNATPDLQRTKIAKWRMRERMKTVSVALVLCLNIGVDPPDVIKTYPCARMECWIDPAGSQPPQKALDLIGKTLQEQYEKWQSKARYKQSLDPTVEEVKKLCLSLRRNAKDERVLFHYNGHGVPKPTTNGEIWVFNRTYTQYIPLSIYELQTWMGTPSIYVFDCSAAGLIVNWFNQFAEQRDKDMERFMAANGGMNPGQMGGGGAGAAGGSGTGGGAANGNGGANGGGSAANGSNPQQANGAASATPTSSHRDCILLAACSANEILPMNPDFPADMFTACLTTPIRIALRWFCSHSILIGITPDMLDRIPGNLSSRRTPLGELNWIFTAVTDTIAWNVLPRNLFQKLFRQDLLVASLFRNYLLAERIMRSANCTPISCPKLPPTYQHPMWQAWDLAADLVISQLPTLLADPDAEFKSSPFFTEQLTAFEVWLEFGHENKDPPAQLPIVLQVLLSQAHRLRALVLLGRFLDLGPWAVNLALCVGIFPYVLKLLQSPAGDLRHILVFIWAKILALDKSCQLDLVKENGHTYFITVLSSPMVPADQRTMSAFVLSTICNNCRPGQNACLIGNLLPVCLSQVNDPDPMVRRWMILCMAKMWENFEEAKWVAIKENAHEKLCLLLTDICPEVRSAAVYALGELIGGAEGSEQRTNIELNLGLTLPVITADCSPMVRKELIISLSRIVNSYESNFLFVAQEIAQEERLRVQFEAKRLEEARKNKKRISSSSKMGDSLDDSLTSEYNRQQQSSQSSVYGCLWKIILNLCSDPFTQVSQRAQSIVNRIQAKFTNEELISSPTLSKSTSSLANSTTSTLKNTFVRITKQDPRSSPSKAKILGQQRSPNLSHSTPGVPNNPSYLNLQAGVSNQAGGTNGSSAHSSGQSESGMPFDEDELYSDFYEWSCAYFSKPMMQPTEDLESPESIEKKWRHQRNESIIHESRESVQNIINQQSKSFPQIGIFSENNGVPVAHLTFHPFEPLLITSDGQDNISVWNWEESYRVNSFANCNLPGTRITSMKLLNDFDSGMLMTAANDGVVRIWRGYEPDHRVKMVSSWRAFPEYVTTGAEPIGRLVLDWKHDSGLALVSGETPDFPKIRIWDVERELGVQDINLQTKGYVTALTNEKGGPLFAAGFDDGLVKLFDFRIASKNCCVSTFAEHKSWIVNLSMPSSHERTVISGAASGEIKFWQSGCESSSNTILNTDFGSISSFAVHDSAPLIACGSLSQKIRVLNFVGEEISIIRYHEGFLGQRIGPVSSLAFHPYSVILGACAQDSIISIYSSDPKAKPEY
ncbi:WD40 repeat-containing protein [Heterostelium album PN500]|uniref:WD40 repeat-containing protein n=1 Tax=Heterostelium pallidum (strain ATCC 26659 / Pp 5 / PN500) TaxID=670386 RepID=D3B7S0_HETP5|nr:WD40 repeat-containing protein [Heterostelium album PN500]EFA82813.1 WD40 repeat-containing protein [Heterostelium album PN500]|eukprot:XP_020434930.1 WD40 repeat-containing protein [Heterostelium album PN500]